MSTMAPTETIANMTRTAPRSPSLSGSITRTTESCQQIKGPPKTRREKYTPKACVECQQRKVKCSGEDTCRQCVARKAICEYTGSKVAANDDRRRRKRRRQAPERSDASSEEDQAALASGSRNYDFQPDVALQERIARLEADLRSVTELGQAQQPPRLEDQPPPRPINRTSKLFDSSITEKDINAAALSDKKNVVDASDGETDTFEAVVRRTQSLSISSQLASLRKSLGLGPLSGTSRPRSNSISGFAWELPSPAQLRSLLQVYFRDFECFLPYLDQNDTERRIYQTLDQLEYGEQNNRLYITPQQFPLAALVCNILAMAESLDPKTVASEPRPGWPMYLQGRKLVERCSSEDELDLDLIRYYAIGSGYLMHAECLRAATHAISRAIQLAANVRLNDQEAWSDCSAEERVARKKLWWTIYFMDRRIGQKNGTAYLIRDTEYSVDDFSSEPRSPYPPAAGHNGAIDITSRFVSTPTFNSSEYLQTLVRLGQLWGQIWDRFFAVTASSRGNRQELIAMDERILRLQQTLPAHLQWNDATLTSHDKEDEPRMRRKLTTFTRINTLRLIIRQNPLVECGDIDTAQFCADLAGSTIKAIAGFHKIYPSSRPCGYFISASLVECICQLVPLLQTSLCISEKRTTAVESFRTAYQILAELARTIHSATRAMKALHSVFAVGEVVSLFKEMVAETEQRCAVTMSVQAQSQMVTGRLPASIDQDSASVRWPPELDIFSARSAESIQPQCETQTQGHTQSSGDTPVRGTFGNHDEDVLDTSSFSLDNFDIGMDCGNNLRTSCEDDFGYGHFVYGDFAA